MAVITECELPDPAPAVSWEIARGAAKPTKRNIIDTAESIRIAAVNSALSLRCVGLSAFVILAVMHSSVPCRAQRNQVLLGVFPRMAAEFPVVHFKIRRRVTGLTPPAVATQDLLAQRKFVRVPRPLSPERM